MRRFVLTAAVLALVAVVGAGQPPQPVTPAAAQVPAARPPAEAPLAGFEPLAAFPPTTQSAVRSVLLGSNWLARMNQPQGRFRYGYRPALRRPMDGDDDLAQAQAALALARAARFAGDERTAAVAGHAVLALLTATKPDPADPAVRVPVHPSPLCNKVGFASLLALAIYELPGADPKLVAEADRLCGFLKSRLRPDGSVQYTDGTDEPTTTDPDGVTSYPGYALQAVAASHRVRPDGWKAAAVGKGVTYYRAYFKSRPQPLLAATVLPAAADVKSAEAVFELADALVGMQHAAAATRNPLWVGGFGRAGGQAPTTADAGVCLQGLAAAYPLARAAADAPRAARYQQAIQDAAGFVGGVQYLETNTRHFEDTFRANALIGGFHLSPADGDLRIDAAAAGLSGLVRFLTSGAERN